MTNEPSAHQLRLLLVLAEELHFGRAAKRVFISQPAFSRQIRALEGHLGVTLVERSTRQVRLTRAGEALLPHMRAAVDAVEDLRRAAEELARPPSDRVVIGSYISALPALRILLDELRKDLPGPEVEWRAVDNIEQVRAPLDGEVDAVICYGPMPAEFETLRLGSDARFACLPDAHPLAGRASVTLADLADLPVIGFSPQVPREYRAFWAADPRPDGTPVRYTDHTATTLEDCVSLCSLGHGTRLITESSLALMPRPGVRFVPVTDLSPCAALLAWPASRPVSPAFDAILALLRAHARTTDEDTLRRTGRRWWNPA
ncbi:LysR substrate-binding domain-containing protein [Streptomyces sp. LX-29]|uniref:LysR family transcriptional regulator n=1 Tax=Streptomyces sp. LX-29 TaxID=2900152 RepID=UPI00240D4A52|nr:LysR substrate-binding domain-containing protein [Streptomyces sp. LX-29]WFB07637.1 LysR substrate-binding domain-containing protein [Streptomyces sp. LX-29]